MSKIRSWKFLAFLALFTALFAGCEEPTDNYAGNSNGSSSSSNGGSSSGGSQNWTPPTRIRITKMQLSAHPHWCEKPWDNANGPDVYVKVLSSYNSTSNKTIGKTNVVNNLSCNMLPYAFDNLNISTKYDYQNGDDEIMIFPMDKDNNDEEMPMGMFIFSPKQHAPKKHSDSYSYVLTFENGEDKFKVWIEYY